MINPLFAGLEMQKPRSILCIWNPWSDRVLYAMETCFLRTSYAIARVSEYFLSYHPYATLPECFAIQCVSLVQAIECIFLEGRLDIIQNIEHMMFVRAIVPEYLSVIGEI